MGSWRGVLRLKNVSDSGFYKAVLGFRLVREQMKGMR